MIIKCIVYSNASNDMTLRRRQALTLQQAAQESPVLARLTELGQESLARLRAVEPMIPAALRAGIKAGPIDGTNWCLIVNSNAAAAKLRQLVPAMIGHLRSRGWEITAIRLKIQLESRPR